PTGIDLHGLVTAADLSGVRFAVGGGAATNLHAADLRGANLTDVDLSGADLTNGLLVGDTVTGVNWNDTALANANLTNTVDANHGWINLQFSAVERWSHTTFSGAHVDLHGSYLSGFDITSSNLSGADL